ncbi:hypothetical protein ABB26_05220 [Stenotrophomonas humi]|uniref:Uncharacterized protein n=1 Tax=Stenotrophomonas humi TaxID=405444 RepID=A0A0R0C6V4_9GAMM|nr:hypothetical protein ABB26_05220 [Stenotrophomonas humi]
MLVAQPFEEVLLAANGDVGNSIIRLPPLAPQRNAALGAVLAGEAIPVLGEVPRQHGIKQHVLRRLIEHRCVLDVPPR